MSDNPSLNRFMDHVTTKKFDYAIVAHEGQIEESELPDNQVCVGVEYVEGKRIREYMERTICDDPRCPWIYGSHHPLCDHDDHSEYGELFNDGADYCRCGFSLGMDFPEPELGEKWQKHLDSLEDK